MRTKTTTRPKTTTHGYGASVWSAPRSAASAVIAATTGSALAFESRGAGGGLGVRREAKSGAGMRTVSIRDELVGRVAPGGSQGCAHGRRGVNMRPTGSAETRRLPKA